MLGKMTKAIAEVWEILCFLIKSYSTDLCYTYTPKVPYNCRYFVP